MELIGILHDAERLFTGLHPLATHEVKVKHPGSQVPAMRRSNLVRSDTEVDACGLAGMASTEVQRQHLRKHWIKKMRLWIWGLRGFSLKYQALLK